MTMMAHHEFLPLCDVLFNIISLAAYFCDIVFDVVFGYALFVHSQYEWFAVIILLVVISSVTQQIMSVRWYLHFLKSRSPVTEETGEKPISVIKNASSTFVLTLHAVQMGVLWRYFKLCIPVDLRVVKYEVRDLCMLRLVHAFCESMPLLLIQLHLYSEEYSKQFRDLNTISILFSLFNVCWALASFNKNVRKHNVHRLVLTWLGVIFQFLWRLGTVGARAVSLVAYAHLFKFWIFLVILLHWFSMFLWILSPKNIFHGERLSCFRKILFCSVIAFVYTFAYINLIDLNHKEKMCMFYVVMGLENAMLMFVWIVGVSMQNPPSYRFTLPLLVLLMFVAGLGFMWLYYRYFHVRRLKYEAGGRFSYTNNNNNNNIVTDNNVFTNIANVTNAHGKTEDFNYGDKEVIRRHSFSGGYTNLNDLLSYSRMKNESSMSSEENKIFQKLRNYGQPPGNDGNPLGGIPGVFNCRFSNPYVAAMQKRKRKKPTSFVPPPSITQPGHSPNDVQSAVVQGNGCAPSSGYNSVPFWYRPLPNQNHQSCSENEGSNVGSRPDIHQKLLEKKRKQLAELKEIEEEIKLGKLHRKPDNKQTVKVSQPGPPQDKKPPRNGAPEILLTPRLLPTNSEEEDHYYEWSAQANNVAMYRLLNEESLALMYKTYRTSPDLDSQLSLPRSYTLPREFKYYRRTRPRKSIRAEHFVPSTNSSDGDVDSGDDSDSGSSHMTSQPQSLKLPPNTTPRFRHETKL